MSARNKNNTNYSTTVRAQYGVKSRLILDPKLNYVHKIIKIIIFITINND